jgi:hypothetical protein
VPPFVFDCPRRYLREDLKEITLHQIRFSHASCHVTSVQLPVGELEPFPEVLETQDGIVSQRVCAIVANTTELRAC